MKVLFCLGDGRVRGRGTRSMHCFKNLKVEDIDIQTIYSYGLGNNETVLAKGLPAYIHDSQVFKPILCIIKLGSNRQRGDWIALEHSYKYESHCSCQCWSPLVVGPFCRVFIWPSGA